MSKPNDFRVTEHFSLAEYACGNGACHHCGGVVKLYPKLAYGVELLRVRVGHPLTIRSGYRCARRNTDVGGVPDSFHVQGRAADLSSAGVTQAQIAAAALEIPELRVGFYLQHGAAVVHVDIADWQTLGLPRVWGDLWAAVEPPA
jgi:hypothetical protein